MLGKTCPGAIGGTADGASSGAGVGAAAAAGEAAGAAGAEGATSSDVVARCISSGALNNLLDNIDNIEHDNDDAQVPGTAAVIQRCVAMKPGDVPPGVVMYGAGGEEFNSEELGGSTSSGDPLSGSGDPPPIACTLSAHAERLLWDWTSQRRSWPDRHAKQLVLQSGDVVVLRCTYDIPDAKRGEVVFGQTSAEEMCQARFSIASHELVTKGQDDLIPLVGRLMGHDHEDRRTMSKQSSGTERAAAAAVDDYR